MSRKAYKSLSIMVVIDEGVSFYFSFYNSNNKTHQFIGTFVNDC